jgi:hypothetical protein
MAVTSCNIDSVFSPVGIYSFRVKTGQTQQPTIQTIKSLPDSFNFFKDVFEKGRISFCIIQRPHPIIQFYERQEGNYTIVF